MIATSGITTGTNPKALLKLSIWGGVWSVEAAVQAIGRCCRISGQRGAAKLITWHDAIRDDPGSEFARLVRNPSTFWNASCHLLDHDRPETIAPIILPVQPAANYRRMVQAKNSIDRTGTWALSFIPYMQCFVCGDTHVAKACPYRFKDQVPKDFCVACLLPLWAVDGVGNVHHPTEYGKYLCTNRHKDSTRQLFLRARCVCVPLFFFADAYAIGRMKHASVPRSLQELVPSAFNAGWAWLFTGQLPGVLQLHLQMHKENAERTR